MKTLFIGSDHAGFDLKEKLLVFLSGKFADVRVVDCGCPDLQSVDYPVIAEKVSHEVAQDPEAVGILICGTGIGMSIAANKMSGIRAANVWNEETAKLSRAHNNANVLCLGARTLTGPESQLIVTAWLNTPFSGGRHLNRVNLISQMEGKK